MSGTNPVGTWTSPDFETQVGDEYKENLDNTIAVAKRSSNAFAPHEYSTGSPAALTMKVAVEAGFLVGGTTVTEVAAQQTGTIVAPVSNPRIDRVTLNLATGAVAVATGAEAASPAAPAIPAGHAPLAQVALVVGQTTITNTNITDERIPPPPGRRLLGVLTANNDATASFTWTGTYKELVLEMVRVVPATDGAVPFVRVSIDAGANYKAGASDYTWAYSQIGANGAATDAGDTADSEIELGIGQGNATGEKMSGTVRVFDPAAGNNSDMLLDNTQYTTAGLLKRTYGTGNYIGTTDGINGLRFLFSAGNITSGRFLLWGIP